MGGVSTGGQSNRVPANSHLLWTALLRDRRHTADGMSVIFNRHADVGLRLTALTPADACHCVSLPAAELFCTSLTMALERLDTECD